MNSSTRSGSPLVKAWRRDKLLYLLMLPGLVFFILFKYVPMWGIVIAFEDYSPYLGMLESKWVGLEHFYRLFGNPDFVRLFRNTMMISLLSLVFFFPVPIALALLLNELKRSGVKRIVQAIVYLPHFLSWVVVVGLTFLLFSQSSGLINLAFERAGWPTVGFLTNPNTFWAMLTGQNIWKETGWGTIIFLAAMAGIDPQMYEAARMDGASRIRQIWHITLPAIRSVIVVLLILRIGQIMDVGFEQVFLMMNGAVSQVADVFETYVYQVGIMGGQFSYSTAVGLFKSFVGLALVVLANRLVKRFGEEGVY